jgi:hypothetical protein
MLVAGSGPVTAQGLPYGATYPLQTSPGDWGSDGPDVEELSRRGREVKSSGAPEFSGKRSVRLLVMSVPFFHGVEKPYANNDKHIYAAYLPNNVIASCAPDDEENAVLILLLADRPTRDGRATAYVCEGCACQNQTTDSEGLARLFTVEVRTGRLPAVSREVVDSKGVAPGDLDRVRFPPAVHQASCRRGMIPCRRSRAS